MWSLVRILKISIVDFGRLGDAERGGFKIVKMGDLDLVHHLNLQRLPLICPVSEMVKTTRSDRFGVEKRDQVTSADLLGGFRGRCVGG